MRRSRDETRGLIDGYPRNGIIGTGTYKFECARSPPAYKFHIEGDNLHNDLSTNTSVDLDQPPLGTGNASGPKADIDGQRKGQRYGEGQSDFG